MLLKFIRIIKDLEMKRSFNEAFTMLIDRQEKYKKNNQTINKRAISRDLDVTPTTVDRMMNKEGYFPEKPILEKITAFFNVTLDQLAGNAYFDWELDSEDPASKITLITKRVEFINVYTLIELNNYKNIFEAANNKAHPETYPMPREYADNKKMILIEIEDESNSPLYMPGDLVLINFFRTPEIGLKVLAKLEDDTHVIRTLGEENTVYAENTIYHPKKALEILGVCEKVMSIRDAQR